MIEIGQAEAEDDGFLELVKNFYDRKLWTAVRVRKAVGKWITAEECTEILEV